MRVLYPEEKAREMAEWMAQRYEVEFDRVYAIFGVNPQELVHNLRLFAQSEAPFLKGSLPAIEENIRQGGWTTLALGVKGHDVFLCGSRDEVVPLPKGVRA